MEKVKSFATHYYGAKPAAKLGQHRKERMELCELEKNNPACENFTVKTKKETHKFLKSCVFNNTSSNEKNVLKRRRGILVPFC